MKIPPKPCINSTGQPDAGAFAHEAAPLLYRVQAGARKDFGIYMGFESVLYMVLKGFHCLGKLGFIFLEFWNFWNFAMISGLGFRGLTN